ncbi:MAG: Tat pathway signal protein [Arcobacteraceae bacterium]|jgi:hypothetical protein|nr:Tat pathway signal protein [Arcobacteraceae bacterium]
MQQSRRDFAKKTAIVGATAAIVGSTAVMAAGGEAKEASSNGVVVGKSNKKEILYTKTNTWEEYYKQAK